jgi:HPt (histidine-containing phosphotransfer) domain-containing protein
LNKFLKKDKDSKIKQENNTTPGTLRHTNLTYLKDLTKDNPEMITEMINVYLEESPRLVNTMEEGARKKDWKAMRAAAHSLLPSFYTMGMKEELGTMTEAIQEFALQYEGSKDPLPKEKLIEINELVAKVSAGCRKAFEELRDQLAILEKH